MEEKEDKGSLKIILGVFYVLIILVGLLVGLLVIVNSMKLLASPMLSFLSIPIENLQVFVPLSTIYDTELFLLVLAKVIVPIGEVFGIFWIFWKFVPLFDLQEENVSKRDEKDEKEIWVLALSLYITTLLFISFLLPISSKLGEGELGKLILIFMAVFVFTFIILFLPQENVSKKEWALALYITTLLLPSVVLPISSELGKSMLIFIEISAFAIFFIFVAFLLLRLCVKHSVLNKLIQIWFVILALLVGILYVLKPVPIPSSIQTTQTYLFLLTIILAVVLLVLFWKKKKEKKKEENLQKYVSREKLVKFMENLFIDLCSFIQEYVSRENLEKFTKEIRKLLTYPFNDPEFLLVNKIYVLTILTLILFTIGTIFISGFTHAEKYKQLENETHEKISNICTIYSENSINISTVNKTLTVKDKNGNYTLSLSSLCNQYEKDRKDFVTYFSALVGAVITFFITMYEKFIRNKKGKVKRESENENERK